MKKITLSIAIALLSFSVFAQRNNNEVNTLFKSGEVNSGWYAGLSINYSQLGGKDAFFMGARGAWLINHNIGIGLAGYGFISDLDPKGMINLPDTDMDLAGGYGGLMIEPILMAKSAVHISLPVIIGAGGITFTDDWDWDDCNCHNYDSDAFFVLEPGIEIEFNIIRFFRISYGVYYRHTSNIEMQGVDDDVLKGFSTGISLKFGKF